MRHQGPLILGAGPAGCACAIVLARAGARPLLLDRHADAGDALCGGFLSWRSARQLQALDLSPEALGAHRVTRLRLFAGRRRADAPLPAPAWGLSRYALDNALRQRALAAGADLAVEHVREVERLMARGRRDWQGSALLLATGKHDVRGLPRPRTASDPALGLRLRLSPSATLSRELTGMIELHLFKGGYAGIVLQEDGTANICLAVRKSLLAGAGGSPARLLEQLARQHRNFGDRLEAGWQAAPLDSVGSVPYRFIARETVPGLFRLGDQAAVIPSLAGEGMGIALASGQLAAQHLLGGGAAAAPAYQTALARAACPPLAVAAAARALAENPLVQPLALAAVHIVPGLAELLMARTRIALPHLSCA
ncbi:NAD(P)/FAD-dependent oxidoreductase [Alteraurantiacibacter buctensis]|uniref:NAD(P)-binding protein n=1 Tax=Alteraurantiacibacter buctensis TaxID=1503981 RepID=A0A844YYD7_9SPHN|nr:NAD(P)-binding protein [Alteraurantiacibacter buctensis]MXO71484.1 NAD(P)-binding protein [Alteraurantiacibacter buctensis]